MSVFTSPAWLAALGVLALPILLHLWSRRPGRVVLLGSLRHLKGDPGPRAWGRRLDDLRLLALRLGLLALVVVGLAGPRWPSGPPASQAGMIVLADPRLVADSLAFYSDPLVDSLRRALIPIHLLSPGFPRVDLPGQGRAVAGVNPGRIWPLLQQLIDSLPPGIGLRILANPRARELGAGRPSLAGSVVWHSVGMDLKPTVVRTWTGPGDSVGTLYERRDGTTMFRWIGVDLKGPEDLQASGRSETLTRRSVALPSAYVVADQQVGDEVLSLVAAITSAFQANYGLEPQVVVTTPDALTGLPSSTALVVWLSSQSVSDPVKNLIEGGASVLEFPRDGSLGEAATTVHASSHSGVAPELPVTILRRRTALEGTGVLEDSEGTPLLTVEAVGRGRWYRLATRIDLGWSDLAQSGTLPELLFYILAQDIEAVGSAPVSVGQALPSVAAAGRPAPSARPLQSLLLVLAGVVLLGERVLAHAGGRLRR